MENAIITFIIVNTLLTGVLVGIHIGRHVEKKRSQDADPVQRGTDHSQPAA